MVVWHMLRLYNRLYAVLFKPFMRCYPAAIKVNLNKILSQSNLYLLANQVKWYGVFVHAITDEIIIPDHLLFPHGWLIWLLRQRQHEFLFFGKICFSVISRTLLKWLCVYDLKTFCDSVLDLGKR